MLILLTGSTHCGKTLTAQKLLEKYKYPYVSIDILKMGLIRCGYTTLQVDEDENLTKYLWPILVGMIKTVIENKQNLVLEGCYIPQNWKDSFSPEYLLDIQYYCLILSEKYIDLHFDDVIKYANCIEQRLDYNDCTKELLWQENRRNLELCKKYDNEYILIDDKYEVDIQIKDNV